MSSPGGALRASLKTSSEATIAIQEKKVASKTDSTELGRRAKKEEGHPAAWPTPIAKPVKTLRARARNSRSPHGGLKVRVMAAILGSQEKWYVLKK